MSEPVDGRLSCHTLHFVPLKVLSVPLAPLLFDPAYCVTPAGHPAYHMKHLLSLLRSTTAFVILVFAASSSGQTSGRGTIEGRVTNARSGDFLENARITVE